MEDKPLYLLDHTKKVVLVLLYNKHSQKKEIVIFCVVLYLRKCLYFVLVNGLIFILICFRTSSGQLNA